VGNGNTRWRRRIGLAADDPQHRGAAGEGLYGRGDVFMQHMAKYDSPTKGKDGTSHFGDLDNLHIVSPISMLGESDSGDDRCCGGWAGTLSGPKNRGHDVDWRTAASSTGVFSRRAEFFAGRAEGAPFVLILEE